MMWVRYQPLLVRALRRYTRNTAQAEDLAQAAFVRALEHIQTLSAKSDEHVKAWLLRTGYNLFIDEARRQGRQAGGLEDVTPVYEEDFSGIHVEELMACLPEGLRTLVDMRYLQGYTSGQIGESLGILPATVRTRLRTAMILLRRAQAKSNGNEGV